MKNVKLFSYTVGVSLAYNVSYIVVVSAVAGTGVSVTILQLLLGEIVLYNVFYEISTACTSIVGQMENGHLLHARNLDFGLFMG